ncbi:MAG: orotidine-5'-phosphate decarboxylase [Hydrogenothermaceae bacterium]
MDKKIALALDVESSKEALDILNEIKDKDIVVKVGYSLFIRYGITLIEDIKKLGYPIFLDLKLHDIPNTVYNGVKAAVNLGVDYLTIHALGGVDMLAKAVEAKDSSDLKLLAVTILTSHGDDYPKFLGSNLSIEELALKFAKTAIDVGIDGIVCSSHEVKNLKSSINKEFIAVVPGIRLTSDKSDDQTRIATPKDAVKEGADILVIGRPILKANNKNEVVKQIKESMR